MSHPESDGAAEMLEGGIRAVSTGALRMAETLQRRQQWATRHHAEQLQHDTRRIQQQQRALTAVDTAAQADTRPRRDTAVRAGAGPDTSRAEAATPVGPVGTREPTGRELFPHFAPDVADAAMNDLIAHGDLPAYRAAHRQATQEAARDGRTPDPAELHRSAVELFTDADHEAAAAHLDRAEAHDLAALRHQLAADDWTNSTSASEPATAGAERPGPAPAVEAYDSAAARERRAAAVRAQGYDADTTASALLHDLSFGLPAAAAVDTTKHAATKSGKTVRRGRTRPPQLTR